MDTTPPNPETLSSQVTPEATIVIRAFPQDSNLTDFVTALIQEASDRLKKAARIMSKLNQERPHNPDALRQAGLSWKSNFSTRPLSTLISKAMGRFPRALSEAKYLTAASLPAEIENSSAKTEFFRAELTKALRSHPLWDELIDSLAFEDVVHGWCAAGFLDEDSWLPTVFQQSQLFVPVNTKQVATSANALVLKTALLPTEAYQLLLKAQAAVEQDVRHWNVDMLASAINNATSEHDQKGTSEYLRLKEELERQLSKSSAYVGSKVVTMYHVLAVELNGRVSHYILDEQKRVMFRHEERFTTMTEMLTFFSFEKGDRTLMGSKGIGRQAWAMAGVLDRARNDAVDRLQLSGKLIAQTSQANKAKFAMSVIGNVILIDENFTINESKVDGSPEAAIDLDKYLQGLLDEMTGSISQTSFEDRERVTKGEVELRAAMQGERVDDYLTRWIRQFGYMMTNIQRRMLNPAMDPGTPEYGTAKTLMDRLLTKLTPEEIEILRNTPALSAVMGLTALERANIVAVCAEGVGNPMYDQHKLAQAKAQAQVSPEFAEQVLLAVDDPTQVAEQTRTQIFESDILLNGQEVPVSPRDAHEIHLQSLAPVLAQAMQEAANNPGADQIIQALVNHAMSHVGEAKKAGNKSELVAQMEQMLAQTLQQLAMLQKQEAEKAAEEEGLAAEETAAVTPAGPTPPPESDAPIPPPAPVV